MHTNSGIASTRFRPGTNASPVARVPRVGTDHRPERTVAQAA